MPKTYIAISNYDDKTVDPSKFWFANQIFNAIIVKHLMDRVYLRGVHKILSEDGEKESMCCALTICQSKTSPSGHFIFVLRPGNEREIFIFKKIAFTGDEENGEYTVGEHVETIRAEGGTLKSIADTISVWAVSKNIVRLAS